MWSHQLRTSFDQSNVITSGDLALFDSNSFSCHQTLFLRNLFLLTNFRTRRDLFSGRFPKPSRSWASPSSSSSASLSWDLGSKHDCQSIQFVASHVISMADRFSASVDEEFTSTFLLHSLQLLILMFLVDFDHRTGSMLCWPKYRNFQGRIIFAHLVHSLHHCSSSQIFILSRWSLPCSQ